MRTTAVVKGASTQHGGTELKLRRAVRFGEVSKNVSPLQRIGNAAAKGGGTDLAVKTVVLGGSANPPKARGRGGARNRADRVSFNLTGRQVENLYCATEHAALLGLPLNRMITIHWESSGVCPAGMVRATGRFVDLLTRWLARQGKRTAWIAVHENGPRKGAHVHILAHVPPTLAKALTSRQRAWLRRICGRPYRVGVVYSRPVGGLLGVERTNGDLYRQNLAEALSYVAKGADRTTGERLCLHRLDGGGAVIGRRCSTSQNIGAKARKERENEKSTDRSNYRGSPS